MRLFDFFLALKACRWCPLRAKPPLILNRGPSPSAFPRMRVRNDLRWIFLFLSISFFNLKKINLFSYLAALLVFLFRFSCFSFFSFVMLLSFPYFLPFTRCSQLLFLFLLFLFTLASHTLTFGFACRDRHEHIGQRAPVVPFAPPEIWPRCERRAASGPAATAAATSK